MLIIHNNTIIIITHWSRTNIYSKSVITKIRPGQKCNVGWLQLTKMWPLGTAVEQCWHLVNADTVNQQDATW